MLKMLPNILTFGRLVLTVIFLVMILILPNTENRVQILDIGFVLFVIAGITDIIDGKVARSLGVASKFGRMLDPLVDKVLVGGAFICFALVGIPNLFGLSGWQLSLVHWFVAGILIAREVYVTVLRHISESHGVSFAAVFSGKLKMFLQSFSIGTVLIKAAHLPDERWADWFTSLIFAATIIVTVVSGVQAGRRTAKPKADISEV